MVHNGEYIKEILVITCKRLIDIESILLESNILFMEIKVKTTSIHTIMIDGTIGTTDYIQTRSLATHIRPI
jgi:hypothetical protein